MIFKWYFARTITCDQQYDADLNFANFTVLCLKEFILLRTLLRATSMCMALAVAQVVQCIKTDRATSATGTRYTMVLGVEISVGVYLHFVCTYVCMSYFDF